MTIKPGVRRSVYAALVSFLAYSCVYAFRKPFTVGNFDDLVFFGLSYQTLLIIAQVLGYMLSKFYGIRFISGLKKMDRWKSTAVLIGVSWISLFFFAIIPPPFGMFMLFINGFMLGFMWGIIFSYIEGRTATDFIGTVLALSFIFASGFTRTIARWISLSWGVSDFWMPFVTGLLFILPLIFFVFLLEKMPPPDESDQREKSVREPMNNNDRKHFLRFFGTGLFFVAVTYFVLTVMRDIRDNFMSNIWDELGYAGDYSIFTKSESLSAVLILLLLSMMVLIRKNFKAFVISHALIALGLLLAGISSVLFVQKIIGGAVWMQTTGLGLYLGYILFNCIFFERMIASFRIKGNIGFVIYFVDAFGYLGSVSIMITKSFLNPAVKWVEFYSHGVIFGSGLALAGTVISYFYFRKKAHKISGISAQDPLVLPAKFV